MKPRGFAERMVGFSHRMTWRKAVLQIVAIVCAVAFWPSGGHPTTWAADATLRLVVPERPEEREAPAETTPNTPAMLTIDSPGRAIESWSKPGTEIALRRPANPVRTASHVAASTPSADMKIRSSSQWEPVVGRSSVRRLSASDQQWIPRGMGPERRALLPTAFSAPATSSRPSPEPDRREKEREEQTVRHGNQLAALALSAPVLRPAKTNFDRWAALEKVLAELFPASDVRLVAAADELFVQGYARDANRAARILAVVRDRVAGDEGAGRSAGSMRVVSMLQIPEVRPFDGPIKISGPFGHGK